MWIFIVYYIIYFLLYYIICTFIFPLKIKENLRVVQQLQSELPLISLYQIICRRKLMSVANEIKIKCICICEFVNPIDALVRSNWNWIILQNSKLRFTFCGTCHATCHIEPRLSTFACVLLPLCFMQQPNLPLYANASSFSRRFICHGNKI